MTMLPDIPQTDWEQHQSDLFTRDTDQRIASLPLHVAPVRDDWMSPGAFAPPQSGDTPAEGPAEGPQPVYGPFPVPDATPPPDAPAGPPEVTSGYPAPDAPLPTDFGTHADARIASLSAPPSAEASTPPADQATSASTVSGVTGPPDLVAAAMNAADKVGLDPNLYVSLIQQESNFKPTAGSPVGAQGLAQLMPGTARGLGVSDPFDPIQSLEGGAQYLKQQLDHFGGDVVKALAAYNAGPGAVEKYGGIPPYEETQRYVNQIMGRLSDEPIDTSQITGIPGTQAPGATEGVLRAGGALADASAKRDISQFGDPQLTADEAYAACGPAAAVRFASMYGRNPTLREATDLAKQVGWTPAQGMAGIDSEASLMQKIGVPVKVVRGPQWDVFAQEAQTGNPVTISTAGHYFFADGYDPNTGKFHVGRSGLDLRRGAEWMSPDQMTAVMGPVQGALLADNPQVPAPSTADQQDDPLAWLGRTKDAIGSSLGGAAQSVADTVGGAASSIFGPQPATQPAAAQPTPSDALANPLGTGTAPQPAPVSSMTPPQPQQTVWDRIGQGISDVFKSAFGGNQTMAPEGGGYGAVPSGGQNPLDQLGQAAQTGQSTLAARGIQLDQPGSPTLPPPLSDVAQQTANAITTLAQSPYLPTTLTNQAVQTAGQAISQSGLNELRSQYFPNITEPNHPINVLGDLVDRYASPRTGVLQTQNMTPEDRQRLSDAALAIGGVEGGIGGGGDEATRALTGGASDRVSRILGGTQEGNFLRSPTIVPTSDPRPADPFTNPGLPNVKAVMQQNLAEVLPDDAVLYHETSVPNARAILQRIEAGPRNQNIWTADTRDLALGQGGKGVMLEFDPALVNGGAGASPTKAFSAQAGMGTEYQVDKTLRGAVQAIVVNTQRQADQLAADPLLARRFDFAAAQQTPEGIRIPYAGPPRGAPVSATEPATVGGLTAGAPPTVARASEPVAPAAPAGAGAGIALPRPVAETPAAVTRGGGTVPPVRPPAPPVGGGGIPPVPRVGGGAYQSVLPAGTFETPTPPTPGAPLSSQIADARDTVFRNLTRAFTDRQVDINQAQQRYAQALGRPLNADEMAAELQRLSADPAAAVKIDEGLKPAIQSVGDDYNALRDYVTLRSNVQVADALGNDARLFSGGMTKADSQAALQQLQAQLGPDRFQTVQRAADQVSQFSGGLRQRLVDSGVLSQDQANAMEAKYPDWVKTRILDYMRDPTGGQGAGTKIGLSSRDVQAYTQAGTIKAREDPVASTVAYAHQVERMANKNDAFNAMLKIDQASPSPLLRQVPQDFSPTRNQVTMVGFSNGQKVKYVTDNKALGEAINGAGVMSVPEWTSAWQKVFRSLATSRNPVFLAGNAALDIPTYTFRTAIRDGGPQALPGIMADLARGYGDAFQGILQGEFRGASTSAFLKGGGGQSGYFTGGEGQTGQAIEDLRRSNVFQIDGKADLLRLAKDLVTLKPVEALGERVELGPRVAAYNRALARGANPVQAVIDGRTVTVDFSQGGTVTKYLNNFVPFLNVGAQGPVQIARAWRDNPRAFVATTGTLIGLPTVAAEVWNRADPQRAKDYADVPDYIKNQGVVVMLPGEAPTDAQGNRKPLYAVLKLREWAPFAAIAREATARALGDNSRSLAEMAQSIGTGLSPTQSSSVGQLGSEALSGIPVVPAALQLEQNRDFFRSRDIVTQRNDQNSSAVAKSLTPAIQAVLDRAGVSAEVRPSAVDFFIRNQGAGVGGAALGAGDIAAGTARQDTGPTSLPGVGGLVSRFVGNQTGQGLQTARGEILTQSARDILRQNGITSTPGPVGSAANGVPLRLEEETRYQQLANRYVDEAIHRAAANPNWTRMPQSGKQALVDELTSAGRERAAQEVIRSIGGPSVARRRVAAGNSR